MFANNPLRHRRLRAHGTPLDITVSELAIEAFFPADERTAQVLAELAEAG